MPFMILHTSHTQIAFGIRNSQPLLGRFRFFRKSFGLASTLFASFGKILTCIDGSGSTRRFGATIVKVSFTWRKRSIKQYEASIGKQAHLHDTYRLG